jgi:hypothetical protein
MEKRPKIEKRVFDHITPDCFSSKMALKGGKVQAETEMLKCQFRKHLLLNIFYFIFTQTMHKYEFLSNY